MQPVIELAGVTFSYHRWAVSLAAVDLVIQEGEFVAIAGPNGGGKTTLLRVMLGLAAPATGRVRLFGEPVERCSQRSRIGYLPQRALLGVRSPATVRELITAGRAPVERRWGPLSRQGREKVAWAAEEVGLTAVLDRPVSHLSGGQQQRAFLAKLLAGEPRLIALDEPTNGVDADAQERLGDLLCHLNSQLGVTILYVSHEFGAVENHVRRLVLVRGGVTYDGPPAELPTVWHDPSHHHGRAETAGQRPC